MSGIESGVPPKRWQFPALIDIAAERDPRGCFRALLRMESLNRCNSSNWQALFRRWITAEPDAALEGLLDLPDRDTRHYAGGSALATLKAADPVK